MKRLLLVALFAACCGFANAQNILLETFDNNQNGWRPLSADSVSIAIADGMLVLSNNYATSQQSYRSPFFFNQKGDMTLTAKILLDRNKEDYGSGFYIETDKEKYNVLISSKKFALMSKYPKPDDKRVELKKWTKFPFVHRADSLNELKVTFTNGYLSYFVNNELVYSDYTSAQRIQEIGFIGGPGTDLKVLEASISPTPQINKFRPITLLQAEMTGNKKENVGAAINSEYEELRPIISADGKTLYYVINEKNPRTKGNQDIVFSEKVNGVWMPSRQMEEPLNNQNSSNVLTVSSDNNTLVLCGSYLKEDNATYSPFMPHVVTRQKDNTWSKPKQLNIENFQNKNRYSSYSFSANYQVMISSVERDETFGGEDLYVSFSSDGFTYSTPKNLGAFINSHLDEICPFLAPDNKTLYFSSYWLPGYGSADIFVTHRLDDTWTNWSEPENLGPNINSPKWDAYFTLDAAGEYAYLSSSDGTASGESDIFRIKLPQSAKPEPVVLVYGKVLNKKNNEPIATGIDYSDIKVGQSLGIANSSAVDGSYKIVLPRGKVYQFLAEKDGFYSVSENIDLTKLTEYKEVERNLYLSPLEVGATARLNNIFFETNSASLKAESIAELNRLVAFLKKNSSIVIEVSGHTDATGNTTVNTPLSANRAKSVYDYLIKNGITATRLSSKGYGSSVPVASNTTEVGKQQNRRVEFTIKAIQ